LRRAFCRSRCDRQILVTQAGSALEAAAQFAKSFGAALIAGCMVDLF